MKYFLDPKKPIATCASETCDQCFVRDDLHCHFTLKDLFHFFIIASPSFLLGGAGIYLTSRWMLILWLILILSFFGFVEIRVMCSHCPHYAEETNSLKCWANYGSPKIWKYRPGPMTFVEKVIFFFGFALIWGYPLFFLIPNFKIVLLISYLLAIGGFFGTLGTAFCSQCINFACPLNTVKMEIRKRFFERNPDLAKSWFVDTGE